MPTAPIIFIETIFNCYKDLVKFFRQRGAMKKVYETTREFEYAVNQMLGGIAPPEALSEFFGIFEEARYSDHEIGADQRDRAIAALQNIVGLRITASRPAADSTIGGGTVLPKRISTYRRVVLRSWSSRGETLDTTSLADEKRLL